MKKRIIAVVMMLVMVIACPFAVQDVNAATESKIIMAEEGQVANSVVNHSFTNDTKRDVVITLIVGSRVDVDVALTNLNTSEKKEKAITTTDWVYDSSEYVYYYDWKNTSLAASSYQIDVSSAESFNYIIGATAKVKTMEISSSSATITAGQKKTLKVTDAPGTVKWSSSKKSVATVSSKGVVTAKKAGKTTITAKSGSQKVTCKVTVKKNVYTSTKLTMSNSYAGALSLNVHKAAYKNGKIVCNFNIVNKTTSKIDKFKYITITIKTASGKTIAKQKFTNLKWSMSSYSIRAKSLTISKKNVKKKSADLRNAYITINGQGVSTTYRYY